MWISIINHTRNFLNQYWCVNHVPRFFFTLGINIWGTNYFFCACFDPCTAISEHIFYPLIKSYCTLWYWQYDDISKLNFLYQNCILLHISLKFVPRSNSQSVSIGLVNGLMLHRRPAITWANCDQVYQRIYESSNLNVLIWWKCMVSYCRYHNGRTFIISCWRAWKVYANYICYILGRSLSCLIFCNYDSPQNWTWRMWSYILTSECQQSFQASHKITS